MKRLQSQLFLACAALVLGAITTILVAWACVLWKPLPYGAALSDDQSVPGSWPAAVPPSWPSSPNDLKSALQLAFSDNVGPEKLRESLKRFDAANRFHKVTLLAGTAALSQEKWYPARDSVECNITCFATVASGWPAPALSHHYIADASLISHSTNYGGINAAACQVLCWNPPLLMLPKRLESLLNPRTLALPDYPSDSPWNSGSSRAAPIGDNRVMAHSLPVAPLWSGFLVDSLAYAVVWFVVATCVCTIFHRIRSLIRTYRGLCPNCAYDLSGLPATTTACPECGTATRGSRQPIAVAAAE